MSNQSRTDYDNMPFSNQPPVRRSGFLPSHFVHYLPFLVLLAACFFMLGRKTLKPLSPPHPVVHIYPADVGTIHLKAGPWGDLEYLPISIAAPTTLLNVQRTEESPVRWFFKDYTRDRLAKLLESLNLPDSQQNQLLAPEQLEIASNGVVVKLSREVVFNLPEKAITSFYQILALSTENNDLRETVPVSILEYMTEANGVSPQTAALFQQVSWQYHGNFICYCLPHLLASLSTYEAKNHFMKAISRQKTMLLKMWVKPHADIDALNDYWGKACWSTDVRAILESLAQTPGGGLLDVIELLPPLPTQLLYNYPVPQNSLLGQTVRQDCMWTSFNFFRDPPDAKLSEADYILEKLKTEYYQVITDPRYGDIVMFTTPDLKFIHSAVYLADNIVFTRIGDNPRNPWMLSTIDNLLDIYSINVPEGQKLTLYYFRSKYY